MPITTQFVAYFPSSLTVRPVGPSEIHSIAFDSGEAAELEMERGGYRFFRVGDGCQIWERTATPKNS